MLAEFHIELCMPIANAKSINRDNVSSTREAKLPEVRTVE